MATFCEDRKTLQIMLCMRSQITSTSIVSFNVTIRIFGTAEEKFNKKIHWQMLPKFKINRCLLLIFIKK